MRVGRQRSLCSVLKEFAEPCVVCVCVGVCVVSQSVEGETGVAGLVVPGRGQRCPGVHTDRSSSGGCLITGAAVLRLCMKRFVFW